MSMRAHACWVSRSHILLTAVSRLSVDYCMVARDGEGESPQYARFVLCRYGATDSFKSPGRLQSTREETQGKYKKKLGMTEDIIIRSAGLKKGKRTGRYSQAIEFFAVGLIPSFNTSSGKLLS